MFPISLFTSIVLLSQAINILHAHTLELRGLNPEKSAHALLSLMQMFEGRIQKVRRQSIMRMALCRREPVPR
jgi:hypothetical protein